MNVNIGVFVCDCGSNIASVVDVPKVVEHAAGLPGVVYAEEGRWICAVDYLDTIKERVDEHSIDRLVVACCTPRTHEQIFKSAIEEAGLNQNMLEFVSIREQCSWVHKEEPEPATAKAMNLVEMGVAKVRLLAPRDVLQIPVGTTCLVVGGGIAGLTAADALAGLGYRVVLVERSTELGGKLNSVGTIAPSDRRSHELLEPLLARVRDNELIEVRTGTELAGVSGYIGHFKVSTRSGEGTEEFDISTIIIATGMTELEPEGLCGFRTTPNIITQLDYEKLVSGKGGRSSIDLDNIGTVAFINCVNSRNDERGCCNVGCITAAKSIKNLKAARPDTKVFLFHRDLIVPGTASDYLDDALQKADAQIRYPAGSLPQVETQDSGGVIVRAHDMLLEEDVQVQADLVVLVSAMCGDSSAGEIQKLLRIPVGNDNFFQEAHVKLKPVDFATEGIYLAGCARSPKGVIDTVEEALGTAMRSAIPMKRGYIESDGLTAEIEPGKCISCSLCVDMCAYGAVVEAEAAGDGKRKTFRVLDALCKGCGTCVAGCPTNAITMPNYSDTYLSAQLTAALDQLPEEKLVAFACHWCALGAADIAGVSRLQYPTNVRIMRVMCSGSVDPVHVLRAFEQGAPGVLVMGCEFPTCHYVSGNLFARHRLEFVRELLARAGIEPERLRTEWLSAAQGDRFAKVMRKFSKTISALGPVSKDVRTGDKLRYAIDAAGGKLLRMKMGKLPESGLSERGEYERIAKREYERSMGTDKN